MILNKSYIVKGRVQGVWFRHFTHKEADKRSLSGFVMNQEDGSVYIEVTGEAKDIDLFSEWVNNGSPLSIVEEVICEDFENAHEGKFFIKS